MNKVAQQIRAALAFGTAAFHAGKSSVPAFDSELWAMVSGRKIGEAPPGEAATVSILEAWSGAWHAASIAEPTTGSATVASLSPDEIAVRYSSRPDVGQDYLTFDVPNGWDDVKRICKKVLLYSGRRFTFRGWNSDRNECFFSCLTSDNAPADTAKILRK